MSRVPVRELSPAEASVAALSLLWRAVFQQLVDREATRTLLRQARVLLPNGTVHQGPPR